jgi:hypothetical protein
MRQEIINIYTIEDHPNKELCFEWIRNNWHDLGEHCIEDMKASLRALNSAIDGTLDFSICIVPDQGEFVKITDYDKDAFCELVNKREECPLTGMCYDQDVIQGLNDGDLGQAVLSSLHAEGNHIYSDEGLTDLCEGNEYEFLECGKAV